MPDSGSRHRSGGSVKEPPRLHNDWDVDQARQHRFEASLWRGRAAPHAQLLRSPALVEAHKEHVSGACHSLHGGDQVGHRQHRAAVGDAQQRDLQGGEEGGSRRSNEHLSRAGAGGRCGCPPTDTQLESACSP